MTIVNPSQTNPLAEQLQGVTCLDLRFRRLFDLAALRVLLRLLREQKVDVMHALSPDVTRLTAWASRLTGIPLIVTPPALAGDRDGQGRRAVKARAVKIVCTSAAATDDYRRLTGLPAERFQTIYNGLDLEWFYTVPDKDSLRAKLGLPRQRPLITLVGALRPGTGRFNRGSARPQFHEFLAGR